MFPSQSEFYSFSVWICVSGLGGKGSAAFQTVAMKTDFQTEKQISDTADRSGKYPLLFSPTESRALGSREGVGDACIMFSPSAAAEVCWSPKFGHRHALPCHMKPTFQGVRSCPPFLNGTPRASTPRETWTGAGSALWRSC